MVLTGANRLRGARARACAPSNTPIAAPIAVSTWITAGEDLSEGSTVLRLAIIGSGRMPPRLLERVGQRLQVHPQRVGVEVAVAPHVLEGVDVLVRRLRALAQHQAAVGHAGQVASLAVARRCGRPPPSGTGSPRGRTRPGSAARARRRGCPSSRRRRSGSRSSSSVSSMPEPTIAGYRSPCPGGAHSRSGLSGQLTGWRSSAPQLGDLVLHEVERHVGLDVGMALERRQRRLARREAVHQQQRQPRVVAAAQRQHLLDDDVEEGLPLLDLQQRLGAVQAHAGPQAAVELEHHRAVERLAGAGLVLRQLARRRAGPRSARCRPPPACPTSPARSRS